MRARTALLTTGVTVVAGVLAWNSASYWQGDYPTEAGPVINDLIHGRIGDFLSGRPLMGPLSLLLRAPFAALSLITGGGGAVDQYETAYRLGVFPCALAGGILGLVLFRIAERERRSVLVAYGALVLCTINPLTSKALTYGHPEEILGGALVAGSLLAALWQWPRRSAGMLVAAIATKQWALLAAPTIGFSLPWRQVRRALLVVVGVGLLLTTPLVVADPGSFVGLNKHLLDIRTAQATPTNVWSLFLPSYAADPTGTIRLVPDWLGILAHPLIIVTSVLVPFALRRHIRANPRVAAPAVLALVLLLRAALDPLNNSYYQLPFFLTLVTGDVLVGTLVPSILATAAFVTVINLSSHPQAQSAFYVIWVAIFGTYLVGRAAGRLDTLRPWRRSSTESTTTSATGSAVSASSS